jgi:hypothetical protein
MNKKDRGRELESRFQFRKMHGFASALRGLDTDYVQTAGDQILGQLIVWLWSSSLGEGPASRHMRHTVSLGSTGCHTNLVRSEDD